MLCKFTPYLFTSGSFRHELRRQLVFKVSAARVGSFSRQQSHRLHLIFMILQRAGDVQGSVSAERLKYTQSYTLHAVCGSASTCCDLQCAQN